MKHLFRTFTAVLSILITFVILNGCKENTLINSKVSPSNNAVGVYDTVLPCITSTYYYDTAITSAYFGGVPIYQGVGTFTDPFFGTMTCATYFNIIPLDYSAIIDSLVDSAVLVLPYSGFTYGDTLTQTLTQTYQVFYMLDTISASSNYFSYSSKPIDVNHPLSAPTTVNVYHLRDSFGLNILPQDQPGLRIKLNLAAVKNRLYPAVNILANSLAPTTDFLHAFNGICIQAANNNQFNTAIPYFQLDGTTTYTQAGILIYTHDPGTQNVEIAPYYFNPEDSCAHFNNITKSFGHFPVNNLFHNTQPNSQVIALQNKPGASIDVIIPGIKSLPAGIINKAELQFTLLPGFGNVIGVAGDSITIAPERLYPIGVGTNTYPTGIGAGVQYNIADRYPIYSNTPLTVIDGYLHGFPATNPTRQVFTIDLPREVMASIAAKNDTIHLQIDGTQDYYGAFHMVAGGGSYPDTAYRAKLFVVYSKLKN